MSKPQSLDQIRGANYFANNPLSIRHALDWSQSLHTPIQKLDAQILLLHCLGREVHDKAFLITHDEAFIEKVCFNAFQKLVMRRALGEPCAYLIGRKEFYGLDFFVEPSVLIPRPETETLIDWALECSKTLLTNNKYHPSSELKVLDLGTGSGCIAVSIKKNAPYLQVWATDLSAQALSVAKSNAAHHNAHIQFSQGSWFQALAINPDSMRGFRGPTASKPRFDLIVSNPPYIAEDDPHLEKLNFEPIAALTSGALGQDALEAIAKSARFFLNQGGWLILEHGYNQAQWARTLLGQYGYSSVQSRSDLSGISRCTGGQWVKME
jgi:release factor glutamine methyltransferase